MSNDSQDRAESFDEEMIGGDRAVTSDQVEVDFPPERTHGIQFADADITDESFAERSLQEQPEVFVVDIEDAQRADDGDV